MKQLSGLDATFLYLETPEMPMHVGALHVFELPPGYRGKFVTALRKHMATRLPIAPVLRRRVWWMPLNMANPAWVDAEPDLMQHIVEVKLPAAARQGSGMAALEAAVAELHAELLPRDRPLWKFVVFEGLAPSASGARRVAMYSRLHHAAVDGQAAVALANAILDLSPTPRTVPVKASQRPRTYQLEMTEMLRGVLGSQAQKVAQLIRELPATVSALRGAAGKNIGPVALLRGTGNALREALSMAPRTVLNTSVSAGRAFATVSLPLDELKALGREQEATLNDMVLMLCSSALRRYFAKRRALPRKSLIAAVPISLREKGDTSADNQASMTLVSLGTHLSDPLKRLNHIKAATARMKATMGSLKNVLPTDFPSLGIPWLIEAATALYGKAHVAERVPQPANLVISNVPGPPQPLYMAGARMLTNYPASIVVHGMALNITVQSYANALDFGLTADRQAMPDVRELADALLVALDDLRALSPRHAEQGNAADAAVAAAGAAMDLTLSLSQAMSKSVTKKVTQAVSDTVALGTGRKPVEKKGAGGLTRSMGAAVTDAMKGAVSGAVQGAMKSAMQGAMKTALGTAASSVTDAVAQAMQRATRVPAAREKTPPPKRRAGPTPSASSPVRKGKAR